MEILKKETVFKGHYNLHLVKLKTAKGKISEREQFETPNSIAALVHHADQKKIILVEQFRLGPEKPLLEIVAGKIELKDDDIEETVKREVREEVGYHVRSLELLHSFHPTPGPITERMSLYYAQVDQKISEGGGLEEENEEIKVIELSEEAFRTQYFEDAKSLIAQKWFCMKFPC